MADEEFNIGVFLEEDVEEQLEDIANAAEFASNAAEHFDNVATELSGVMSGLSVNTEAADESIQDMRQQLAATIPVAAATAHELEEIVEEQRQMAIMGALGAGGAFFGTTFARGLGAIADPDTVEEVEEFSTEIDELLEPLARIGGPFRALRAGVMDLILLLPAAIAGVTALAAGFGALATAAIGTAAVVGGVLVGAIMQLSSAFSAAAGQQEGFLGGFREFMTQRVLPAINEALRPLRQPEFVGVFQTLFGDFLSLLNLFAREVVRFSDVIIPMIMRLRREFFQVLPEIIVEFRAIMREMLPLLEEMGRTVIRLIPRAMQKFREHGITVVEVIFDLVTSLLPLIVAFAELGQHIFEAVNPAIQILAFHITHLADALALIPPEVLDVVGRFIAFVLVAESMQRIAMILAVALEVLVGVLATTVGRFALLATAATALLTMFGGLREILAVFNDELKRTAIGAASIIFVLIRMTKHTELLTNALVALKSAIIAVRSVGLAAVLTSMSAGMAAAIFVGGQLVLILLAILVASGKLDDALGGLAQILSNIVDGFGALVKMLTLGNVKLRIMNNLVEKLAKSLMAGVLGGTLIGGLAGIGTLIGAEAGILGGLAGAAGAIGVATGGTGLLALGVIAGVLFGILHLIGASVDKQDEGIKQRNKMIDQQRRTNQLLAQQISQSRTARLAKRAIQTGQRIFRRSGATARGVTVTAGRDPRGGVTVNVNQTVNGNPDPRQTERAAQAGARKGVRSMMSQQTENTTGG